MLRCSACGRESGDDARFCSACGAQLAGEEKHEARKTVTVLFADLAGSTAIGERLDPEAWRRVQSRYFEAGRTAVERHGGTVEKFAGDAVMAVFGVPTVHEDDALRAVRAAAELRDAVAALDVGVPLSVRIGVNTGEVVTGLRDALVTGDAVNVAARLEQAAAPGEILLGVATHRLVRDAVRAEALPPLRLKGKAEAVATHRLLEIVPGAAPLARRLEASIIGRRRELSLLIGAFNRAVEERTCHLFTVLGAAGIGKTRLANELAAQVSGHARVLVGQCLSYGEGITFWPVAEMVRQAAGEDVQAGLASLLGRVEDGRLVAERVAAAVGLESGGGPETFWGVRRLFETLAAERPLVLVFEDVHWAEPTLLDLVEHVAEWTSEAPILLLCLARPELFDERPAWGGGKLNATAIVLEPLAAEEVEAMIGNLLGDAELEAEQRARVARAAQGNPLFVEQMVAMLAEGESPADEVAVPPAIQALLAARLDRLSSEERLVIEAASIEGESFHSGGLAELLPPGLAQRADGLVDVLIQKELVRRERADLPGQDAYRFRHALIREAAYEAVSKERRAELHERVAIWLERTAGDGLGEVEAIVGYHLERAYRYRAELALLGPADAGLARRAGERLGSAGRRALRAGDAPAGAGLLERALAVLSRDDPLWRDLVPDLSWAIFLVGASDRADALVAQAIESARASGDRGVEWHAVLSRDRVLLHSDPDRADPDAVAVNAERALAVFEELEDAQGLARAWAVACDASWMKGRLAQSAEEAERALHHAAGTRTLTEQALGAEYLAWAWVDGPAPVEEALARCGGLLLEVGENLGAQGSVLSCQGALEAMLGRFEAAREHVARGLALLRDLGLRSQWANAMLLCGEVELLAGEAAAAEEWMRAAGGVYREFDDRWWVSTAAVRQPRALYEQGRYEEALRCTDAFALETARRDAEWQIRHRGIRAKALARHGRIEEAEALAREGTILAAATDFLNFHAEAFDDLAEVLRLAGRPRGAAEALAEALHLYERKGNLVAAERTRRLLAELEA